MRFKSKTFGILIVAGLIVIIIIYFFSKSTDNTPEGSIKKSTAGHSKEQIIKSIDSILYTFGLKDNWIKNKVPKNAGNEKGIKLFSKDVSIPRDLLSINLNFEISNYLKTRNLFEKVIEDPKTKNIVMNIFSQDQTGEKQIGVLKFIYSDSIKRSATDVCLVLDSLDSYSQSDAESVIKSNFEFSVILPLRNDRADFQSLIMNSKRDFVIYLTMAEKDQPSGFRKDTDENSLRSKIVQLSMTYPEVSGIIIDDFNEIDFNKIIKENSINTKFSFYRKTIFSGYQNENKINSLFKEIISKSNVPAKPLIFRVNFTPEEFALFDKKADELKKLGHKFYTFREFMKKNNMQVSEKDKITLR